MITSPCQETVRAKHGAAGIVIWLMDSDKTKSSSFPETFRFKFDQMFDSKIDFDGWVACWCLAQQRQKTFRDLFLRLNLDDPLLDEEAASRYRSLHFEFTAALVRELLRLIFTRKHYATELADGPEELTGELAASLDAMEQRVNQTIGDSDAVSILRNFRDRTFHLPIIFKPLGKPEQILMDAIERVSNEHDGVQQLVNGGTIGTTELTFARHIEAALLALTLEVPDDDPNGEILHERLTDLVTVTQESVGSLDSVTHQLLRLQLLRKGFAEFDD